MSDAAARGKVMLDAAAEWNRTHPYARAPGVALRHEEAPTVAPHPEPEVPARRATRDEFPPAALAMVALLREHGWKTEVLYARGTTLESLKLVELAVVRGQRIQMPERIVAVWKDGGYEEGYWRIPGDTVKLGANDLKKQIKTPIRRCAYCGRGPYDHQECAP